MTNDRAARVPGRPSWVGFYLTAPAEGQPCVSPSPALWARWLPRFVQVTETGVCSHSCGGLVLI